MSLQPIDLATLTPEVFRDFVSKNALLTAGNKEGYNTMTIGWGQLGSIWKKAGILPSPSSRRTAGTSRACAAARAAEKWIRRRSAD